MCSIELYHKQVLMDSLLKIESSVLPSQIYIYEKLLDDLKIGRASDLTFYSVIMYNGPCWLIYYFFFVYKYTVASIYTKKGKKKQGIGDN